MANASPSRLGAINLGADKMELFLKVFMGEVLTSFERANVTLDKHQVRTISHGKSASFPVIGTIGASYHTPGEEILGTDVKHAEKIINVDALLISHAFIALVDEAMNHYEVRSTYSMEMGRRLANEFDLNVFAELVLAARSPATISGADHYGRTNGGTVITDADFGSATAATKAAALAEGIYAAKEALQTKDIPLDGGVYCALKPEEYNLLIKTVQTSGFSPLHRDYGGAGSYSKGTLPEIGGISLVMSNNVPTTDLSARTYHGVNASTTKAIIWTPPAVGTVKWLDLAVESQWDIRRQGTLMVAKYLMGHGVLRPECAVELRTGAPV